jgi:hypothetical protein
VKAPPTIVIVGLVAGLALVVALPSLPVCRDFGFIDQNTGARKGYREWFFGGRTGFCYRETALETFMHTKHPAEFRQQWVSYAGTGRNVFGGATVFGHGRPGPIIQLRPEMIDEYCGQASESEKKGLYDALASGKRDVIQEAVNRVIETVFNQKDKKTEPDGAANGSQPIRSETNSTSGAAGSRR